MTTEIERLSHIAATAGAAALRNFTGTRAGQSMWNWDVEKAADIAAPYIAREVYVAALRGAADQLDVTDSALDASDLLRRMADEAERRADA